MWINRSLAEELERISATFPVVVLTGPRQTGKTSILERAFPGFDYVSLDVSQQADAALTRPEEFLNSRQLPLIIDEVQYAPSLLKTVKTMVDRQRGANGLFLITGSQSFPLMQAVTESLAGRAAVVPFHSLSFKEWRESSAASRGQRNVDFQLQGGFPALWSNPDAQPDRERWYQGYVATYLERDVRSMLNIGSLRDFGRFLRACATRTGGLLNMSDIARDIGVAPSTAREWISVLQASGQVTLLEPYHRSLGKRLAKSPKLYFNDTGLAMYLAGISSAAGVAESHLSGSFWENHVISQWIRWRDWLKPSASLWYWKDQSNNEVDLLVEIDGRLHAIECKRTERPGPDDVRRMRKLVGFYGPEAIGTMSVACLSDQIFSITDDVVARPGWDTWDLARYGSGEHQKE